MSVNINVVVFEANRRIEKYGFDHQLVALQEAIIKTKKPEYIYGFAKGVKGADIDKLTEAMKNCSEDFMSTDLNYVIMFAKNVKGADLSKLEDAVINKPYTSYEWIRKFASAVPGVNLEKLTDAIIKTRMITDIRIFAQENHFNEYVVKKTQEFILTSKNAEELFNFALNVKGADLKRIQDRIIEISSPHGIYRFARYIKGADIEKLEEAIIKIGKAGHIYDFAFVAGANIPKLYKAILETGDKEEIQQFERCFKFKQSNEERDVSYLVSEL